MFQCFWLANAFEGGSLNVFYQRVDPLEYGFIGFLPVQVVVPGVAGEGEFHSTRIRSVPLPDSSSAMDSSRRLALAGERSRYAVSSMAW